MARTHIGGVNRQSTEKDASDEPIKHSRTDDRKGKPTQRARKMRESGDAQTKTHRHARSWDWLQLCGRHAAARRERGGGTGAGVGARLRLMRVRPAARPALRALRFEAPRYAGARLQASAALLAGRSRSRTRRTARSEMHAPLRKAGTAEDKAPTDAERGTFGRTREPVQRQRYIQRSSGLEKALPRQIGCVCSASPWVIGLNNVPARSDAGADRPAVGFSVVGSVPAPPHEPGAPLPEARKPAPESRRRAASERERTGLQLGARFCRARRPLRDGIGTESKAKHGSGGSAATDDLTDTGTCAHERCARREMRQQSAHRHSSWVQAWCQQRRQFQLQRRSRTSRARVQ